MVTVLCKCVRVRAHNKMRISFVTPSFIHSLIGVDPSARLLLPSSLLENVFFFWVHKMMTSSSIVPETGIWWLWYCCCCSSFYSQWKSTTLFFLPFSQTFFCRFVAVANVGHKIENTLRIFMIILSIRLYSLLCWCVFVRRPVLELYIIILQSTHQNCPRTTSLMNVLHNLYWPMVVNGATWVPHYCVFMLKKTDLMRLQCNKNQRTCHKKGGRENILYRYRCCKCNIEARSVRVHKSSLNILCCIMHSNCV